MNKTALILIITLGLLGYFQPSSARCYNCGLGYYGYWPAWGYYGYRPRTVIIKTKRHHTIRRLRGQIRDLTHDMRNMQDSMNRLISENRQLHTELLTAKNVK